MSWETRCLRCCTCDSVCVNRDKRLEIERWNQRIGIREPACGNRDKKLEIERWNQRTGIKEPACKN